MQGRLLRTADYAVDLSRWEIQHGRAEITGVLESVHGGCYTRTGTIL